MTEILPYMQRLQQQFDDPKIRGAFVGFTRTLQFVFTDSKQSFLLKVSEDGSAALEEGTVEKPDVNITTTTDVFAGILDKKVNGVTAYMTRKIKVNGAMDDLNRLQKLMF